MLTEERQNQILKYLDEQKAVTVTELTERLDASESTIRRDLNSLHKQGKLVKVHGGATQKGHTVAAVEYDMTTKASLHQEEKRRIAQYAATLIEKDDFVFIDAGSTTELMIEYINTPAEFVTNGIMHARKLAQKGFRVHLIGGEYKLSTEAIVGIEALQSVQSFHFTKAFLGVNGISIAGGYTTPDTREAVIKSEVVKRAYEAYILGDSSKFDMDSSISFASLEDAQIITDKKSALDYEQYTMIKEV